MSKVTDISIGYLSFDMIRDGKLELNHMFHDQPFGKIVGVEINDKGMSITVNSERYTPYGKINMRGFIPLNQYLELIHATRLEF